MNKETALLIVISVVIIGLRVYFVYLSQKVQDESKTYQNLTEQIDIYKKTNSILRQQVLTDQALVHIDQVARQQGFVEGQVVILK